MLYMQMRIGWMDGSKEHRSFSKGAAARFLCEIKSPADLLLFTNYEDP